LTVGVSKSLDLQLGILLQAWSFQTVPGGHFPFLTPPNNPVR
jgi:hypothetical protein